MFDFHFHKLLVARLFIEIMLMKFLYNIRPFDNIPSIFDVNIGEHLYPFRLAYAYTRDLVR